MTTTASSPCRGPESDEVLRALGLPVGHDYMSFVETEWQGHPVIVCRTGYTGERGYELVPAWEVSAQLWDALLEAAAPLRRTAVRAGRPRHASHRDGLCPARQRAQPGDHPRAGPGGLGGGLEEGRLLGQGGARRRKGRGSPPAVLGPGRDGPGDPACALRCAVGCGEDLGEVTSGTFSPTLRQGIALALLAPSVSEGDEVVVDVRGREVPRPGRAAALRGGRCPRGLTGADTGRRRTPRGVGARQ